MIRTSLVAVAVHVLFGCAASHPTAAPARQAAVPVATRADPRIVMNVLPGWRPYEEAAPPGEASASYRNDAAAAVIQARTLRADGGDLAALLRDLAQELASTRHAACVVEDAEGDFARMRCTERADDGDRTRGIVAVRRPGGRSGRVLVMMGVWPASLPRSFDEEVDLMFLLASLE